MHSVNVARQAERRLGGLEFLYHAYESAGGTNFVVIVEIEGLLTVKLLRQSLNLVQSKHPLLRARVLGAGAYNARFVCDCIHGIPLEVSKTEGDSWVAIAEDEMIAPFFVEEGPLVRCRLLRCSYSKNILMITFNHIIADGRSAANFVRCLMFALSEISSGGVPRIGSRSLTGPVEEYMPSRYRGIYGLLKLVPYLGSQFVRRFRRGRLWDFPAAISDSKKRKRIGRILHFRLDKDSVERLSEACLAKGTTVHGALCAAQLMGICEVLGVRKTSSAGSLCISSPIDIRGILTPPMRNDFGFYIGSVQASYNMLSFRCFWSLAIEIRNRIVRSIEAEEPLAGVFLLGVVAGLVRFSSSAARRYCTNGGGRAASWIVPPHSVLSNLGSLDSEQHFGSFSIEAAHGVTVGPPHWQFGSFVSTYNGTLFWNFVYIEEAVERNVALKIANESLNTLVSNID